MVMIMPFVERPSDEIDIKQVEIMIVYDEKNAISIRINFCNNHKRNQWKRQIKKYSAASSDPYWAMSAGALGCQICRNDDENDYDDDDENDDCDDDDENDRHWATSAGALSCCQICNNH